MNRIVKTIQAQEVEFREYKDGWTYRLTKADGQFGKESRLLHSALQAEGRAVERILQYYRLKSND